MDTIRAAQGALARRPGQAALTAIAAGLTTGYLGTILVGRVVWWVAARAGGSGSGYDCGMEAVWCAADATGRVLAGLVVLFWILVPLVGAAGLAGIVLVVIGLIRLRRHVDGVRVGLVFTGSVPRPGGVAGRTACPGLRPPVPMPTSLVCRGSAGVARPPRVPSPC